MRKILFACILLSAALSLAACAQRGSLPDNEPGASAVQSGGENEGEGVVGGCRVKIVSAEKGEDFVGDPVAIVTYEWTNDGSENKAFSDIFMSKAYQNGVKCNSYNVVDGVDSSKLLAEIEPGETLQVKEAYIISGFSDITVEIGPGKGSEGNVVTKTFSLG